MARTVFFGFGAFVGAIRGTTQIEWWADDPALSGFAATALIPVDLARNPSAARAGTIPVGPNQGRGPPPHGRAPHGAGVRGGGGGRPGTSTVTRGDGSGGGTRRRGARRTTTR